MAPFVLRVRVYLEDTDAQGVVYNAGYFRFMERARTEWLRAQGVDHTALLREHGMQLVLARVEAEFRAPARLDDLLEVEARVASARGARVVFEQAVRRAGEADAPALCRATAEVACVDAAQGRPKRLPAALLNGLKQ